MLSLGRALHRHQPRDGLVAAVTDGDALSTRHGAQVRAQVRTQLTDTDDRDRFRHVVTLVHGS
jgi:hypothetical protein